MCFVIFAILAAFKASKKHSGLFVWSSTALDTVPKSILKGFSLGKGTVRFAPDALLSDRFVKAVLTARAREIKARWG